MFLEGHMFVTGRKALQQQDFGGEFEVLFASFSFKKKKGGGGTSALPRLDGVSYLCTTRWLNW